MSIEAEERIARIERQVAEAQNIAQTAQRMKSQMESLRVTGHDESNIVTAEVNSAGQLTDVSFSGASRLSDEALSQAVRSAYSAATRAMSQQVREITVEAFGNDSDLSQRILAPYQKMMPDAAGQEG